MEVINTTLDTAEEKTNELKDITIDSNQIETQKEKQLRKSEHSQM